MTVVEPNYKICKEGAIKSRLKALKSSVKEIIKKNLRDSISIACTSDCWSSISQQSYITVSAHIILIINGAQSRIHLLHMKWRNLIVQ